MYYKIKIKSQGSEFSLESSNKEVTQREMDLYFANIFGASEEFKSNIKKVEIVNQNIKTIQDFEQNKIQQTDANETLKNTFAKKNDTVKFQNKTNSENDTLYSIKQEQSIQKEQVEQPISFSSLNTPNSDQNIKEDFTIAPFIESNKKEESNKITNELNFQEFNISKEDISSENKNIEVFTNNETSNEIKETNNPLSEIDELINKAQQNIDAGANDTIDISSIIPIADSKADNNIQELMQHNFNFDTSQQNFISNTQTLQIDLKQFIKNCSCQNQEDELLVCAYFIKHILKEPDFTIKYINSKLYQATGSFVGMSVIDELVTKDYIRVINIETPKTYSITTQGEICFAELQG